MSSTGMFLTASGGSLRGGSQEAVSSDKLYRDVIDCPRRQSEGGQSITTTLARGGGQKSKYLLPLLGKRCAANSEVGQARNGAILKEQRSHSLCKGFSYVGKFPTVTISCSL